MNPFEKFHSLDSDVTECISFINFDKDGISLSPSGKRLVVDHSTEALNIDQYRQFHKSMISMGFKDDEWLLLHANLKTKYLNTLKLDNHYYRLCFFTKRFNESFSKEHNLSGLENIYFPFCDELIDELKNSKRKKKYVCYNGSLQVHRIIFINDLLKKNLVKHGLISLHEKPTEEFFDMIDTEQFNFIGKSIDRDSDFFVTSPHSITNIKLGKNIDGSDVDLWCTLDKSHMKDTFFCIVPETSYFLLEQDDYLFITEKTYKSIINHPSIILGRPHTLRHLRELGFKTFDKMFDESYDEELDDMKRFEMVLNEVERLCNMDDVELQKIYESCIDIILHNQKIILSETKTLNEAKGELIDEY